jgi:predicted alpha/beta-fold hydrolase
MLQNFRSLKEEVKMRNLRSVIFGLGFLIGGAFLANYFGAEAGAQQQTVTEAQSWELTVGVYDMEGTNTRFYVVRHNRLTGETQYIGCEDRDVCTQIKLEVQD